MLLILNVNQTNTVNHRNGENHEINNYEP